MGAPENSVAENLAPENLTPENLSSENLTSGMAQPNLAFRRPELVGQLLELALHFQIFERAQGRNLALEQAIE